MYYRIFVVYLLPTECNEALITIINIGMEKQLSIIFFATAAFLAGCGNRNPEFNNGDLLFEVGQGSRMADAIVDATARHEASGFSHVAILERVGDENFVIEATSKGGVRRITLDEFLNEAGHDDKGRPLVAVYRLRDGSPQLPSNALSCISVVPTTSRSCPTTTHIIAASLYTNPISTITASISLRHDP